MENRTGTAVASMVVGIVALVGELVLSAPWLLTSILAVIGIFLAVNAFKVCPAGAPGHGMAVAGLVTSIVAIGLMGIFSLCLCAGLSASLGLVGVASLL